MSLRGNFFKSQGWQSMPLFFIAIVFNILQLALAQTHGTEISGEDEKKQNFTRAFVKSLGIIIASEIGDKTFFIAAIMAMKHPRAVVFAGAMAALVVMTILSTVLGAAAPALLPKTWTHYAATLLFFIFGIKMLWDVYSEGPEAGESELDEVERELASSSSTIHPHNSGDIESMSIDSSNSNHQTQEGTPTKTKRGVHPPVVNNILKMLPHSFKELISPIFIQVFTLTFLGEWGDRSQIATVGLAADADLLGVALGGFLGHGLCTGGAVLGGKHLASRIDERLVTIAGGVLFLLFGLHSLWVGPSS